MTRESAKTVVNSLVVSKVDYCNSLLAACTQQQTDKLQRVLNCAARVILGGSKYDHVTPFICDDLHWLCVPERVMFKLCLLVYKALHGTAPVRSNLSNFSSAVCPTEGEQRSKCNTRGALNDDLRRLRASFIIIIIIVASRFSNSSVWRTSASKK